jgi:hypothetical protein
MPRHLGSWEIATPCVRSRAWLSESDNEARACRFPSSISSLWNYCSKRPGRNWRGLRLKWREGDPTLSSRDAAPVCLRGWVLGAARHPWIWALSKLALFTAGGNSMLRDSAGQQAGAWMEGVSSLETAGRTERCLSPSLFPLPYPASDRHGCTPTPPLPIMTASVRRLPHLVQRNFRSFSGTPPRPLSMIDCRLAGA